MIPAGLTAVLASAFVWRRRRNRSGALLALLPAAMVTLGHDLRAQSPSRPELTAADVTRFADSAFAEYVQHSPDPSLAFVVVRDGAILVALGYGSEDAEGRRAVDPDSTVFWMASLSKLFTAEAVIGEVESGRIMLGEPAGSYLEWPLPTRSNWRAIAVEDLLTHTSGLDEPFMMGTVDDSASLVPLGQYLQRIHWRASSPPGNWLRYSNHAVALAGRIVERTSGVRYEDYVEREVLGPAGMSQSSFSQPIPPALRKRLATAGTDQRIDYLLPAPAGALVGTPIDMGRFLAFQLDTTGAHALAHRQLHTTRWRAHPAVPGVALAWFETNLGGIAGLSHTGARHHFSAIWLAPERGIGLFLVHSMRQGGPYQDLRTETIRNFVLRYFGGEPGATLAVGARDFGGVYRPGLLSTTTIERAGNLFLDTPVLPRSDGALTMRAPGPLGTIVAYPIATDAFEVRDGPHAGLRLGFVRHRGRVTKVVMGGTLMEPITFTRLTWWQRGLLHASLLGGACLVLVIAACYYAARRLLALKRGAAVIDAPAWIGVGLTGGALLLAGTCVLAVLLTTPERGAAQHMRSGLMIALVPLSAAAVFAATLPLLTIVGWHRSTVSSRTLLVVLSALGVVFAALAWHYRLVGVRL